MLAAGGFEGCAWVLRTVTPHHDGGDIAAAHRRSHRQRALLRVKDRPQAPHTTGLSRALVGRDVSDRMIVSLVRARLNGQQGGPELDLPDRP